MPVNHIQNPLYVYCGGILAVALFKLYLVSGVNIFAQTWAGHDDRLFVDLAYSIIQHQWLGEYNQFTLMKGPGFSLWLALLYWLHIPLIIANELIFIFAAIIFSWSIQLVTGSYKLAFFCFVILALNIDFNDRVVRESFYAPLTSLLFALITLQVTYFKLKKKLSFAGVGIFGILLFWFWIVREESIWIIPPLIILVCFFSYFIIKENTCKTLKSKQLLILLIPFIFLFIGLKTVNIFNGQMYKSRNVVEVKSKNFIGAYASLSRVNSGETKRFVPVTRSAREAIFKVSPAYREISTFLETSGLGQVGCTYYPTTCGDIAAGWFIWALRDAVAAAGYYKSGATASAFYTRLANEIDNACQQKLLTCSAKKNSLMPSLSVEDISNIILSFIKGIYHINNPDFYQPEIRHAELVMFGSTGDIYALEKFKQVLYGPIMPLENSAQHKTYSDQMEQSIQIKTILVLSKFYGLFLKMSLLISFIYFIYQIKVIYKTNTLSNLFIISSIILIAIITRLIMLAIIDATSFTAINPSYCSPIYPLTLMFVLINLVDFYKKYFAKAVFPVTNSSM